MTWRPRKDKFDEFFNDPPSCVCMHLPACVCWTLFGGGDGEMEVEGGGLVVSFFCTNTHIHISKSGEEFGAGEQCCDLVLEVFLSFSSFVEHTLRSQLFCAFFSPSLSLSFFLSLSLSFH